jgi:hypothetical protein
MRSDAILERRRRSGAAQARVDKSTRLAHHSIEQCVIEQSRVNYGLKGCTPTPHPPIHPPTHSLTHTHTHTHTHARTHTNTQTHTHTNTQTHTHTHTHTQTHKHTNHLTSCNEKAPTSMQHLAGKIQSNLSQVFNVLKVYRLIN